MIVLETLFAAHDRIALRWALVPAVDAAVDFGVWRSGNAVTGFEQIGTTTGVTYLDRLSRTSKFEPACYRIAARIGSDLVWSNVAGISAPPNSEAVRLARRERFQLAKYDGIPCLLYIRRRTGPPCPRCGDPSRGSVGVRCTLCYGTGVEGGYYPPLPIYAAAQTLKTEGADLHEDRVAEASSRNLWTSNWTIVAPEDVLVELVPPNRIWHVTGLQRSERFGAPIRQLMTVKEADLGSGLSLLPIPHLVFPDRSEIFFHDPDGRDFDAVFAEVLDDATHPHPRPGHEDVGPLEPGRPRYDPGIRDPETGFFS